MTKESLREDRLAKMKVLQKAGINPYPARTERTHSLALFQENFEELQNNNKEIALAGRVMSIRGHGNIVFVDIFDGTGKAQAVLQKGNIEEDVLELFLRTIDRGDFVEICGNAFVTKRGERSLKASRWRILAKSILPIPDEWFGLKDDELKHRRRYLDILLDEEVRAIFVRRSLFWNTIRQFFLKRGFMEVETPVLESTAGGADALPFVTHHNALNMDVYLRISAGELWQKRLLVAGYPKVFEIGRIFRNEGISNEHLQDYTQLEFYEAFSDFQAGMQTAQELYRQIVDEVYGRRQFHIRGHDVDFGGTWETIHYVETLEKKFDIDVLNASFEEILDVFKKHVKESGKGLSKARLVDRLFKLIRKDITGPAFLIGVPVYIEPLAKRSESEPNIVERFQIIIAGSELGKGFSELNDPIDQLGRFEDQQKMREGGDEEAQRLDRDYVEAMEYGMPPAFGFGVSERLFSFLENRNVRTTQIFPLLKGE